MAKTSSFGARRSRVSFDRVELAGSPMGDPAFELSQGVDLEGNEFQSVTWVYDSVKDTVVWSTPIEEFFGFEVGVRGFSVLPDPSAPPSPGHVHARRAGDPQPTGPQSRFASGADAGNALLAPILAPIRL